MCIRDRCGYDPTHPMARSEIGKVGVSLSNLSEAEILFQGLDLATVSYTHLRAHETVLDLVCRLLLEKKKNTTTQHQNTQPHIKDS